MATVTSERSRQGAPEGPADLGAGSWWGVLKRTVTEFRKDNVTDWAAALTYYGVLSISPALIALVSVLGLIGHSATQPLISNLGKVAPGPAQHIFTSAVTNLQNSRGAAGVLFVVGVGAAVWSASGYIAGFMRASNSIYDIEEGRPIWMTLPVRVGVTVVLLVIVSLMFSILYWAAPNVRHPGFRWLSPGGLFAVLAWVIASALFALYVANFSSYNKTYGALGGVVVFLVWLWISNIAVLLGAEFNAELERGRQIRAGHPADEEPFVEPRMLPK